MPTSGAHVSSHFLHGATAMLSHCLMGVNQTFHVSMRAPAAGAWTLDVVHAPVYSQPTSCGGGANTSEASVHGQHYAITAEEDEDVYVSGDLHRSIEYRSRPPQRRMNDQCGKLPQTNFTIFLP